MTTTTTKENSAAESKTPDPAVTEMPIAAVDPAARLDQAKDVVRRNVYWAMGAGVLPLPLVDIAAISGVQLKMLRELAIVYGFKFSEGLAKKAVMSLLVGIGGVGIGGLIGTSLFKLLPVVGTSLGVASVPAVSGMLTHAVGNTFVMHFEAGGTLLDFDPKAMRNYFKKEYDEAKIVVTKLHKDAAPATTART
jgi:uncharacterized protein (DUF697 family)